MLDGVYTLCDFLDRNRDALALLLIEGGKTKVFNLNEGAFGVFAVWIEDAGEKLEKPQTPSNAEISAGDVIVTNTDSDGLGHWELINVSSQNTRIPVGLQDLQAFKARIEKMLKNKKCAAFIRELLEEAKKQTGHQYSDILQTFDQIKFYWNPGQSHALYYPVPSANISNDIITEKPSGTLANQKNRRAYLISQTTQSFLAETFHHLGQGIAYRDGVMANAMNAILVRKKLDTFKKFSDSTTIEANNASIYWHPKVWAACPAPKR